MFHTNPAVAFGFTDIFITVYEKVEVLSKVFVRPMVVNDVGNVSITVSDRSLLRYLI
jgi:hypothetical protein